MADVNRGNRPLSPHLTIYRPQLTSATSILVRITGIAALAMSFFVVWWLLAAATSETAFNFIDSLMRSWLGDLVMFGATWAIFYHMLGRLRHVIWDLGYCVDVNISEKLGIGMLVLATVLSFITAIAV
ncbi:Succinate dehydrogenase cytochrome b556 subunit [Ruegeria sp. THAF57]|uniref:succinate dehydrogenase, cytochrome b556 subunit n=1 Tax=unclassified Ruegeria TaxID=2625375 RepID=UPI0014883E1D|nr:MULTISPECIES: succinate dehydrogenase, cytochrome b556 subunit [unclassified Ruegeria]CAD0184070.1 Succinate dehydrogenase cytochrome b556 subunit [Ruegeria sp. THAF57]